MRSADRAAAAPPHVGLLTAFLADPWERPYADDTLVAWCPRAGLKLIALRGSLSAISAERLVTLAAASGDVSRASTTVLDLRDYIDTSAGQYELLFGFVALQRARRPRGHRTYLVVAGQPSSAAVLGYAAFGGDDFCEAVVMHGPDALSLADAPEPEPTWARWQALLDATREPAWLLDLRLHLAEHIADATVESAARALGMSSRALQRALGERDTSFRRELSEVRVARARALLAAGETKLLAVAISAGFARVESMNEAFERVLGHGPRAHAARRST